MEYSLTDKCLEAFNNYLLSNNLLSNVSLNNFEFISNFFKSKGIYIEIGFTCDLKRNYYYAISTDYIEYTREDRFIETIETAQKIAIEKASLIYNIYNEIHESIKQ